MRKLLFLFLAVLSAATVWAQQRTVRGKVTDSKGSPMAGVTVSVKGLRTAAQTGPDGNFSIPASQGNTLVFSYVGFKDAEATVGADDNISVILQEQSRELSEVVVTAVGIRREAKTLGYAATTVKNEELTRGRDRSVLNSLQGKVAGVNITSNSGGVGSSTRVQFRGSTSLLGNNQALIVVDGIIVDNTRTDAGDNLNNQVDAGNRGNDLNPEDIESVTVLKGPAAAALYGSQASNGALIITTKSGRNLRGKRSEIVLTSSFSLESILKLPDFQNEYGQGGQKEYDSRENFSWGPKFDGKVRPWGQEIDGEQRVKPYSALPNNVKEFFNIGQVFQNGVSLTQNNDRNGYYLSFNNLKQKGVMPGTEYARTSVRLSGNAQLTDKIYSNASINYIRSTGDLSVQGQGASPYDQILQTPRDIPLLELKDYKNNKFNSLSGYYGAYTVNPWYFLGEDSYTSTVDRILGSIEVGYKPVSWLDIMYRIGTDVSADKRKQIVSKRVIPDPDNQNHGNEFAGKYEESAIGIRQLTSDLMITGTHKFNSDLSMRVLVGHNVFQRNTDFQVSTINDLVIPGLYNLANSSGKPVTTNATTLRRLYGVYGSVDLSFRNYLFLGITGRNDWSSTLPKGGNSFFYPGASLSFVFSDAFKMPDWVTYGKLRLSGAKVGKDAAPYSLQSVFVAGLIGDGFQNSQVSFPLNGVPGYTTGNQIGNANLTPEFTTSYETGVEAAFFGGRLGLDVAVYKNESKNQIVPLPIASSTGYTVEVANIGKVTNSGIEIMLRGQPIRTRDFTWEITGTYAKNRNKVVDLVEGTERISLGGGFVGADPIAQKGLPYGSFFGTGFQRDSLGRVVVNATTGYPLTEATASVHGSFFPDYIASVLNSFTYKGFTLTALLDGRKGGLFFSRTRSLQTFVGTDPRTLYNDREPFVIPNSVIKTPDGKYVANTTPVANAQDYWTNFVSPTAMENLIDASFLKLREVSLSYRLPQTLVSKTPFTGIQVGLTGRNLFMWTPKENTYADPEASSFGTGNTQGFEYGTIPSIRSYGANVRITL